MRRFRRTAATTLAALTFVPVASADVIFVNDNAPGPFHNGNNWNSAYTDLQDALAEAVAGDQIWVAGGTYRPTSGTNRTISFNMKTGVKLYGGFVPGATVVDDRDPATNLTILSGEIGGVGIGDNSAHVVRAAGVTASGVLDGFVITRGNANIVSPGNPDRFGGGMKLINGGPTIRNCHIVDNVADFAGGGADIVQSEATFIDCLFSDNAAGSGAGADADNGAPSFWNCRFIGNTADSSGGAIRLLNCTGLLVNCEIKGNVCLSPLTGTKGGGVFVTGGTATIVNSTIIANTAAGGGGLGFTGATATLRNSIIYHNTGTVVGGHLAQIQATSSTLQVNACCIEDLDGSLGGSGNFGDDPLLDPLNSGGAFSLGIAGKRVEAAMAALNASAPDDAAREARLKAAAVAVHHYFIQRELMGMRRHHGVIREYGIPRAVLARLGAS